MAGWKLPAFGTFLAGGLWRFVPKLALVSMVLIVG